MLRLQQHESCLAKAATLLCSLSLNPCGPQFRQFWGIAFTHSGTPLTAHSMSSHPNLIEYNEMDI